MKFLILFVSIFVAVCSAGNLYATDLSSLQSIFALRSDTANTKPNDYPSFTTSVQTPISASFLPQNDESSAKLNQHWHDEQIGTYLHALPQVLTQQWVNQHILPEVSTQQWTNQNVLPQISTQQWTNQHLLPQASTQQWSNQHLFPQVSTQQWVNQHVLPEVSTQQWTNQNLLPQVSTQQWTNQQLSSAHNPSGISSTPQYSDINSKYQGWPSESIYTPLVSLAHTSITSTPVLHHHHHHEDVNAKYSHHWPTEQLHMPVTSLAPASPTTILTQPVAVEKQVPVIVPVPVDRVHEVVKHVPVYLHKKEPESYWKSSPSTHFEVKRHTTRLNPVSNLGGVYIRKRAQFQI
ncbi:uncharacterized protein LOC116342526 [Contarinia nasturtii]|uniref:uncharacterized protein LOC116342526 n=1 Tax=Contarinia nasturtii TaxID=265458 RepID=UPI0012D3EA66|nr:uncharacterized protein LOC116342526 [Contarinia nasturtii]